MEKEKRNRRSSILKQKNPSSEDVLDQPALKRVSFSQTKFVKEFDASLNTMQNSTYEEIAKGCDSLEKPTGEDNLQHGNFELNAFQQPDVFQTGNSVHLYSEIVIDKENINPVLIAASNHMVDMDYTLTNNKHNYTLLGSKDMEIASCLNENYETVEDDYENTILNTTCMDLMLTTNTNTPRNYCNPIASNFSITNPQSVDLTCAIPPMEFNNLRNDYNQVTSNFTIINPQTVDLTCAIPPMEFNDLRNDYNQVTSNFTIINPQTVDLTCAIPSQEFNITDSIVLQPESMNLTNLIPQTISGLKNNEATLCNMDVVDMDLTSNTIEVDNNIQNPTVYKHPIDPSMANNLSDVRSCTENAVNLSVNMDLTNILNPHNLSTESKQTDNPTENKIHYDTTIKDIMPSTKKYLNNITFLNDKENLLNVKTENPSICSSIPEDTETAQPESDELPSEVKQYSKVPVYDVNVGFSKQIHNISLKEKILRKQDNLNNTINLTLAGCSVEDTQFLLNCLSTSEKNPKSDFSKLITGEFIPSFLGPKFMPLSEFGSDAFPLSLDHTRISQGQTAASGVILDISSHLQSNRIVILQHDNSHKQQNRSNIYQIDNQYNFNEGFDSQQLAYNVYTNKEHSHSEKSFTFNYNENDNKVDQQLIHSICSNKDHSICSNKDYSICSNKDNSICSNKDHSIYSNKDNSICSNKDHNIYSKDHNELKELHIFENYNDIKNNVSQQLGNTHSTESSINTNKSFACGNQNGNNNYDNQESGSNVSSNGNYINIKNSFTFGNYDSDDKKNDQLKDDDDIKQCSVDNQYNNHSLSCLKDTNINILIDNNTKNISEESICLCDSSSENIFEHQPKDKIKQPKVEPSAKQNNEEIQKIEKTNLTEIETFITKWREEHKRRKMLIETQNKDFEKMCGKIQHLLDKNYNFPFENISFDYSSSTSEMVTVSGDNLVSGISKEFPETSTDIQISIKTKLTVKERIYTAQEQCQKYWSLISTDLNKYKFETLHGTIHFVVDIEEETGIVQDLDVLSNLDNPRSEILFVHKESLKKLQPKMLKAAIGEKFDIITLLDYIQMNMVQMLEMLDYFSLLSRVGFEMDDKFRVSLKFPSIILRSVWIVSIDMSDLDTIDESCFEVSATVGTVDESKIRNFIGVCPKGFTFLRNLVSKIIAYQKMLESRRKR